MAARNESAASSHAREPREGSDDEPCWAWREESDLEPWWGGSDDEQREGNPPGCHTSPGLHRLSNHLDRNHEPRRVDTTDASRVAVDYHQAWEESMGSEIWDNIIPCLATCPWTKENGIAAASRLMNVRWRKYHRTIVKELLDAATNCAVGTSAHITLLDLSDILFT